MSQTRRLLILPIFLLWLFAIIVFYYWGHQASLLIGAISVANNPLLLLLIVIPIICLTLYQLLLATPLAPYASWTTFGIALVVIALFNPPAALLLLLICHFATFLLTLGIPACHLLGLQFNSRLEMILYATGFGGGMVAFLTVLLSNMGRLSLTTFWVISVPAIGVFFLWLWERRPDLLTHPTIPADDGTLERFDIFFKAILAISLFIGLLLALLPPVGWDGLSTHLVLVKRALAAGQLLADPVFERPLVGHMLYIWGMGMGGDHVPQLISFALSIAIGVAIWFIGDRYVSRRVGLIAMTMLFAVEVFVLTAAWPYADLPTAWYAILTMLALLRWLEDDVPQLGWIIASAIFCALAVSSKLNGLFILPVLVAGSLAALWWRRGQLTFQLIQLAVASASCLLIMGFWGQIQNAVTVESASNAARVTARISEVGTGTAAAGNLFNALLEYVRIVWNMTIIGQQGAAIFDGTITPFFLMLVPLLLFLGWRGNRPVLILTIAALIQFGAWLLFPQGYYQSRHLIIAYPLFALLAAYVLTRLDELDQPWFELAGFFRLIIVLVLGAQTLFYLGWVAIYDPLPILLGQQSRDDYLESQLNGGTTPGYYSMILKLNASVPTDARIGFARPEPRLYYCQADCRRLWFEMGAGVDQIGVEVDEAEIDYLLVSWEGIDYFEAFYEESNPASSTAWGLFRNDLRAYLEAHGEIVFTEEAFTLYQLRP